MLAAYAALQACILPIYLITGGRDIEITGEPTTSELVLLAIIGLALPLMAIVGWLVSRSRNGRTRAVIATIAVAVVACVAAIVGDRAELPQQAVVVAVVLILTGSGVGSVVGWALRMMLSHLSMVGALAIRALPVVLLTALVFFSGSVWQMAATISGNRLALAIVFLVFIASAFVAAATRDRLRPMLRSPEALPKDTERLANTPFATMPDTPEWAPLKKTERVNMVFVLAGLMDPQLLDQWTHVHRGSATALGFTLPLPDSLIRVSLFLGALTFMYISARAAGDDEYRSTFLDPLIDDLHTTLIARNRYRGAVAPAPSDAPDTPVDCD